MNAETYRKYAYDCLQMAHKSTEAVSKAALLDMAVAWVQLAEQAERIHDTPYLTSVADQPPKKSA